YIAFLNGTPAECVNSAKALFTPGDLGTPSTGRTRDQLAFVVPAGVTGPVELGISCLVSGNGTSSERRYAAGTLNDALYCSGVGEGGPPGEGGPGEPNPGPELPLAG